MKTNPAGKLLLLMLAMIGFLSLATAARAADTKTRIGLVDMRRAVSAHPRSKQAEQEVEKEKQAREKAFEAKLKAKFKVNSAQELNDDQKQELQRMFAEENEKFNRDMNAKLEKRLNEVQADVMAAVRKVGAQKKFDYVLDKSAVLIGGEDITAQVIAAMKKK